MLILGKKKGLADSLLWESSYAIAHLVKFFGPHQLSSDADNSPLYFLTLEAVTALYW